MTVKFRESAMICNRLLILKRENHNYFTNKISCYHAIRSVKPELPMHEMDSILIRFERDADFDFKPFCMTTEIHKESVFKILWVYDVTAGSFREVMHKELSIFEAMARGILSPKFGMRVMHHGFNGLGMRNRAHPFLITTKKSKIQISDCQNTNHETMQSLLN